MLQQEHPHFTATYEIDNIRFISCQSALPFLRYSYFRIWTWNIYGQGHGSKLEVTYSVQHQIDLISFCFTSIRPSIHEIQLFQYLTLKIHGQGHEYGKKLP